MVPMIIQTGLNFFPNRTGAINENPYNVNATSMYNYLAVVVTKFLDKIIVSVYLNSNISASPNTTPRPTELM